MILCVTFLLAMALSVSGYVMVRQTMDARLAQETADSQRDMQVFGVMLQSLTDSSLSFQTESVTQAASRPRLSDRQLRHLERGGRLACPNRHHAQAVESAENPNGDRNELL